MRKTLLIVVAIVGLAGCTDPKGATEALQDAGYSRIQIGGYSFFGCSKDDNYATNFVAQSPGGFMVRGVVCSGLFFKGATVRTFGRV